MGHIGLTPQSVNQFGGFKIQGKDLESAKKIIEDAKALERVGVFSIVLEGVPTKRPKGLPKILVFLPSGLGLDSIAMDKFWLLMICWACLPGISPNL